MLEWLIVGGGMQGTIAANFLIGKNPSLREKIRILDPHEYLLANWNRNTKAVGMDYLRSSFVHHLGFDPFSLQRFAMANKSASWVRFTPPYQRPSLELFQRHCQSVIEANQLNKMVLQGSLLDLEKINDGYRAITSNGEIESRKILLAWGVTESCQVPKWCEKLTKDGIDIKHVYASQNSDVDLDSKRVAILGGGISALQLALKFSKSLSEKSSIHVLSRHPLRISQFDSDKCWMGPRCLREFNKVSCPTKRREIIKSARRRGFVPPDVLLAFKNEMKRSAERLQFLRGEVVDAVKKSKNENLVSLHLSDGNDLQTNDYDMIICATGFDSCCPNKNLVEKLSDNFGLPRANCGYPLLSRDLSWGEENIFAIGSLAELRMGPTSRNIIGARQAADLLL